MDRYLSGIREPVKRLGAEHYLLITLLSFATTVSLVRFFLDLTGYPQLGGGGLHIAHMLWGGLALFIASLLPIIFANRWVLTLGAILSGVGVGLFIDEVGKFITANNNYFFPAAAPIIYAFFLLTVLVYLRVRNSQPRDPRAELYQALEAFEEVLDHDLSSRERGVLVERLRYVSENINQPDLALFARYLLNFVESEGLYLAPETPPLVSKVEHKLDELEERFVTRSRLLGFLAGATGALGLFELSTLFQVLVASFAPVPLLVALSKLVHAGLLSSSVSVVWFWIRVALEGGAGLALFFSAILLITGRDRRGTLYSYYALLVSLTVVDLLIFYFNQFSTIVVAIMQFILLLGVIHYRQRYLHKIS